MFVPKTDNQSDLEGPHRNSGPWLCSICSQQNDTSCISCEVCGVLRDLSLYFSNANEAESGAKRRNKHSGVSVLARSLFTPSGPKLKAVVFPDGFQGNKNAAGHMQASLGTLHKTYMARKQRRDIVPFKFDVPSPDDMVSAGLKSSRHLRKAAPSVDFTGKEVMGDDDHVAVKDTSTDPSSSVKLGGIGGTSSGFATDYCIMGKKVMDDNDILVEKDTSTDPSSSVKLDETLILDNELQHLSIEKKPKNSKAKIKKPVPVLQYKPEPWMLQGKDLEMPRQLNLAIVGHVDSGKSTLCGRLLHALGRISKKQMHKNEKEAKEKGKGSFAYAWAMDESADERARGITMNVGVAYFDTKNYQVVMLDSPGHKDFVPNMISGVTQADAAVLVVDASLGSFESGMGVNGVGQTKEHSQLIRSFGVENLIVAVNKMDSVEYSVERFNYVKSQLGIFLRSCGYKESAITWVPLSAMENENLVTAASDTRLSSWFHGTCLLEAIDSSAAPHRDVSKPLRLPICDVISSHVLGQVAVCGKVVCGAIRSDSKVLVMPSGELATVKIIERDSSRLSSARAGDNVAIGLQGIDPIHVMSGGVLCHPDYPVSVASSLELKILVLDIIVPILPGLQFELHAHHAKVSASLVRIVSLLDQKTGKASAKKPRMLTARQAAIIEVHYVSYELLQQMRLNMCLVVIVPGVCFVQVKLEREVCVEEFGTLKALGRAFLRWQGSTVAVGVVTRVVQAPEERAEQAS
ncbi:HBS1-like protein isoform X1 [Triticum dicoccoides]|uniref:HBS1-like protein isoform X1 n=2 Tax=Triticum dicoccoides TaxID=85692 RepID=UPI00188FFC38|nr:HBS1-like protein isoform X1 [Triticum dicoccoides]